MRAGALTLPVSDERGVAAISAVWPLPVHASPDATSRALQHCCLSSQVTLYDSLATAARRQAGRRTSKIVSLRVALVSPAGRLKRFRACLRSLRERLIWLTDLLLAVLAFTGRVARPGKFKSSAWAALFATSLTIEKPHGLLFIIVTDVIGRDARSRRMRRPQVRRGARGAGRVLESQTLQRLTRASFLMQGLSAPVIPALCSKCNVILKKFHQSARRNRRE
jgi:hypothetical protein